MMLLEQPADPRGTNMIVVCGEALIDLVPVPPEGMYRARPGGSPANVAVGLGRLGTDVTLLARIADDAFGRLLRDHLARSRVRLDAAIVASEPSTLAVVSLDRGGKAEYAFYVEGSADGGWRIDELPAELPASAALHVSGSLALGLAGMGDALETLLRREKGRRTLTFDPNTRPGLARDEGELRARLQRWLGLVDVVKVSSDDLAWVAPGEPLADVAERWRSLGPALVVVTRGEDGVYALGPSGPVDLPGPRVTVVDTVGAGDAFMAGLLAALDAADSLGPAQLAALDSAGLERALAFAQGVAAVTCGRIGADPPWREELPAEAGGDLRDGLTTPG
jgi:fructokinase